MISIRGGMAQLALRQIGSDSPLCIYQLVPYARLISAGIGVGRVRNTYTPVLGCRNRSELKCRITDLNRWPSLYNDSCLELYSSIRDLGCIADYLINRLVNMLRNHLRPSCHGASC